MRAAAMMLLVGCSAGGSQLVGEPAPKLALKDADGVVHDLAEQDGVVVVDFSAVWCGRCKDAAPELEALHVERGDEGVTVWTVLYQNNSGDDPTPDQLREWATVFELTHTVLGDEGERAWDAWGRGYQPVTFVIDPGGMVVWHGEGAGQRDAIDEAIDGAL